MLFKSSVQSLVVVWRSRRQRRRLSWACLSVGSNNFQARKLQHKSTLAHTKSKSKFKSSRCRLVLAAAAGVLLATLNTVCSHTHTHTHTILFPNVQKIWKFGHDETHTQTMAHGGCSKSATAACKLLQPQATKLNANPKSKSDFLTHKLASSRTKQLWATIFESQLLLLRPQTSERCLHLAMLFLEIWRRLATPTRSDCKPRARLAGSDILAA